MSRNGYDLMAAAIWINPELFGDMQVSRKDVAGELVLTEQLAAVESLLRSIIDQGVRSDWFIRGGGMVLQVQNQTISEVVGKSTDILGRPPLNILPELVQNPFISLIRKVYDTSQPYQSYKSSAYIVCNCEDE